MHVVSHVFLWPRIYYLGFILDDIPRMWVSHVFLLQLRQWRPLPFPQTLQSRDIQAATAQQHMQEDLPARNLTVAPQWLLNQFQDVELPVMPDSGLLYIFYIHLWMKMHSDHLKILVDMETWSL